MIEFINNPDQINEARVKLMLNSSASFFQVLIQRLVYSFVSKEKMLDLNKKFLNHNTDTDIITFPYGTDKIIISEVFISPNQAIENATQNNQSAENEIVRLVSHGFLHSIGFQDKTEDDKRKMSSQEDMMINMFHVKQ
ncbi:MAG: rRNA maturation RNase YbeY [Flavobacteriaceae bacterium]|nr:rRNA maturation RNase YbeY [Flavobacteriaceae bacterium]